MSRQHQVVGEQHRERLVAHKVAGAPDRMAEAERLLLADIGEFARVRQPARDRRELGMLALSVSVVEFVRLIEVILDALLPRPVTKMNSSIPAARASSTAYWISGLSTTGSISLGTALVAGRNRVPSPATGNTAFRITGPPRLATQANHSTERNTRAQRAFRARRQL